MRRIGPIGCCISRTVAKRATRWDKLHWRLNNRFQHHGGAGFHALGFDPSFDLRKGLLTFMFDDDAMKRSEAAVLEQLPRMIHAADRDDEGLAVETLFTSNCNDTPVTSDILGRQLVLLRDEGEILIKGRGRVNEPRARTIGWGTAWCFPRAVAVQPAGLVTAELTCCGLPVWP